MVSALETQFTDLITFGLRRRAVTTCSEWAQRYRIMGKPIPGPMTFKYHPWAREMHDSNAVENVGQKSAQAAYTETALNRTFFKIDVERTDCLYVLPNTKPDAADFSSARFDAALELSEHLATLFSDVKNVGHKRAGSTNLYVRGSRGRGGLKSIPVGFMVLDEYDEMDQAQVSLALERMSGQFSKQVWKISTPTAPNFGINKDFNLSTQEHFFFQCPACSRWTELIYPDCLIITADSLLDLKINSSHIICKECKNKLDHQTKYLWLRDGQWRPTVSGIPDVRGFYINQLYSSTVSPIELARSAIKADLDPTEEQEFHNSKLGLAHLVKGAQVSNGDIDACIRDYVQYEHAGTGLLRTMGVDVGNFLHVEIDEWQLPDQLGPDINTNATPKIIAIRKLRNFEELDTLMRIYQIHFCIVDIFPEKRKAKEFADRFFGYVKLCYYGRGVQQKTISEKSDDESIIVDHQITVDRTTWLDLSLGRFINRRLLLPKDISSEYREHIKNQFRIYEKDALGNPVGRYEASGPDHFGHARNYAEIALPFAAAIATSSNVTSFL